MAVEVEMIRLSLLGLDLESMNFDYHSTQVIVPNYLFHYLSLLVV